MPRITDDIEELVELDAEKVSAVTNPANGTPFLLLKAADGDPEDPHAEDTESAEADQIEATMTKGEDGQDAGMEEEYESEAGAHTSDTKSPEADHILDVVTKAVDAFCGLSDCDVCKERFASLPDDVAEKAKLNAKARHALPDKDFAYIDSKGGRHLPIPDASHVRNALARFDQTHFESAAAKRKARRAILARAKALGVKVSPDDNAAKMSPGVPAYATATPVEAGHISRTGRSGLAGPETDGLIEVDVDPSFWPGGKSTYNVPADARQDVYTDQRNEITENVPAGVGLRDSRPSAFKEGEIVVDVIEKTDWLSVVRGETTDDDESATTPGSPAWEDYDASTLDKVAQGLAECARAVARIQQREAVEAVSGNPDDWFDAYELSCAGDAINYALGFVARLAYHEAAAGDGVQKAGRSAESELHVCAALSNVTALFGVGANPIAGSTGTTSQEDIDMQITKEELTEMVTSAAKDAVAKPIKNATKAARSATKAAERAAKRARKAQRTAEKAMPPNAANNGGNVSAEDERAGVNGEHDAADVNAVPDGGKVRGEYLNKETSKGKNKAFKAMADELSQMRELVTKMASRPRAGGPVLDGVPRGVFPAAEQRLENAAKGVGDSDVERLEKAMEATGDPVRRAELSQELTYTRLRKAHEDGLI